METTSGIIYGAYETIDTQVQLEIAGAEEKNTLLIAGKLPILGNYVIQSNQNRTPDHYYFCTGYSTAGVLGNMFGWTLDHYNGFLDDLQGYCENKGQYDKSKGAYTDNTATSVEELHNIERKDQKVKKVKTQIGTSLFWTLLNKGYTFAMTYTSGTDYANDAKDGRLDGTTFGNAKGGHSIRFKSNGKLTGEIYPTDILALDNYYKNKQKPDEGYKQYLISQKSIKKLVQNEGGVYFPNCYTFIEQKYFDK